MANEIRPNFHPSPPRHESSLMQPEPHLTQSAQPQLPAQVQSEPTRRTNAAKSYDSIKLAAQGSKDTARHVAAATLYGASSFFKKTSRFIGRGAQAAGSRQHSKISEGLTSVSNAFMTAQRYLEKKAPEVAPKPPR